MEDTDVTFNQIQGSTSFQMSIANEHADTFYSTHFDFKDPVNATYIIAFWVR